MRTTLLGLLMSLCFGYERVVDKVSTPWVSIWTGDHWEDRAPRYYLICREAYDEDAEDVWRQVTYREYAEAMVWADEWEGP